MNNAARNAERARNTVLDARTVSDDEVRAVLANPPNTRILILACHALDNQAARADLARYLGKKVTA